MHRRRSPLPTQQRQPWDQMVRRLVCPCTGWCGGRWRWRVRPGSRGRGRWRRCWRWWVWVAGWCWRVGGWCRRRGGRGRCPADRRGEPASLARGLVAGGSGWAASSPLRVLAVGRRGLRPAGPADPSVRPAVGPSWLRPGVLVDPPGHVGGPWGPVLARGAVASPATRAGAPAAGEGAGCPGRRVAPRRERTGVAPVLVVSCPAWPGAAPTVAAVKPGRTEQAAGGRRRRLPAVLRGRRPLAGAEARSVQTADHHGPPRQRARRDARMVGARPRLDHPLLAAPALASRQARRGEGRQVRGAAPAHQTAPVPAPPHGAYASRPPGSAGHPVRASASTVAALHARARAPATPK